MTSESVVGGDVVCFDVHVARVVSKRWMSFPTVWNCDLRKALGVYVADLGLVPPRGGRIRSCRVRFTVCCAARVAHGGGAAEECGKSPARCPTTAKEWCRRDDPRCPSWLCERAASHHNRGRTRSPRKDGPGCSSTNVTQRCPTRIAEARAEKGPNCANDRESRLSSQSHGRGCIPPFGDSLQYGRSYW